MSAPGNADVAALRRLLASGRGPKLWRGSEAAYDAALEAALGDEFPSFRNAALGTDRREFLRVMAASFALAGLSGCTAERSRDALPYVVQPEDVTPGRPSLYATSLEFDGLLQPVLATMHRGRPTKLDGNPDHPAVAGRSDLFTQAAILDLYDPDRSQLPLLDGRPAAWPDWERLLVSRRAEWRRTGGQGLALLVRETTSPTFIGQVNALKAAYPQARVHLFEPLSETGRRDAARQVFGRPLDTLHRLDAAKVVVSLDDDLLGPGSRQVWNVQRWAQRRGDAAPAERQIMHVAESTPSQTGAAADRRLAVEPSRLLALAVALAARLGVSDANAASSLSDDERAWVDSAARDLKEHAGHGLFTVGAGCPAAMQSLALAVNARLGNIGAATSMFAPVGLGGEDGIGTLADLVRDLEAGRIADLLMIDVDPVYAAPADLDFAAALRRAALTVHAGLHVNETAAASRWHLPLPHALETWSDGRAVDGTLSISQPLIEPLYSSRSRHELIDALIADQGTSARDIVRGTWRARFGDAFDERWTRALHDGFVAGTAADPVAVTVSGQAAAITAAEPTLSSAADEVEIVFAPDPTVWDGHFVNNAWLQELGKPLTRTTWENVILVSPALAERRGLANGDIVRLTKDARFVEGPAWIMPGQAARTVTLFLGYGQAHVGEVGQRIGYDAYRLRTSDAPRYVAGATLTKGATRVTVASTQPHQHMEGDDFVRIVPTDARAAARDEDREQQSMYPQWPSGEQAWGMIIDLDLCTGCNACTIACQAENNVPVVGKEQVTRGRHMHWLRVDHYHAGALDAPKTYFQPVPCMHCEQAPCEMGCPVHATVHGPDGLNQQIYNRCIGTRTCSSYCPYKVRRFNWFDYTSAAAEGVQAQRNPDVTVRGRGVMEKCTYCVQRIRAAHAEADKENRAIGADEVLTACQQACPSRAITFGNLADPASAAARARGNPRNYALLSHLGTRPRTTYLARIAADAAHEGDG